MNLYVAISYFHTRDFEVVNEKEARSSLELGESAILGSSHHPAKTQRLAGERLFLSANPKDNLRFSAHSVSSLPLLHPTLAVLGERARMFPSPTPRLLSSLVYNLPFLILSLMSHQDIPWDLT